MDYNKYNLRKGGLQDKLKNSLLGEAKAWVGILAVALSVALMVTACAPRAPEEGKQVVRIGMIAPLTGAPAAVVQIAWRNLEDCLKYFEEKGIPGVTLPAGVKIELLWGDSGFEVAKAISIYERMRERNVVLYYLPSPVEGEGLKSRLERDQVPGVVMSVSENMMYPPGWIFTIYPTESERFAVLCDWIMENWKEERPPRIALMGTDSPSGRAPEVMGTAYARSLGMEVLPFEIVPYVPLDVTPQLVRLQERGADYAYIQAIWSTVAPIMRDAQRLGLTGKVRFGGMENSQSIALLELGSAVEGYLAVRSAPWYKEVPILEEVLRKYQGRIDTMGDGAMSLILFPAWIKAISTALENVGYENLDGRAVKEGFYSVKDFDPYGLGRKVTYTPQDHRGAPVVRIYEIRGGDVVPLTGWISAPMLVPES